MTEDVPSPQQVLRAVSETLEGDKADDVVVIDLAGKTSIADYMVVASGTSKRHIGSMADHIIEKMKHLGLGSAAVEGSAHCDWVLIDAGDVVVHLFRPEIRAFYALERLWGAPALVSGQVDDRRIGFGM